VEALHRAGIEAVSTGPERHDIDTADDLEALMRRAQELPPACYPHVRAVYREMHEEAKAAGETPRRVDQNQRDSGGGSSGK
jgi:hypothetical protein